MASRTLAQPAPRPPAEGRGVPLPGAPLSPRSPTARDSRPPPRPAPAAPLPPPARESCSPPPLAPPSRTMREPAGNEAEARPDLRPFAPVPVPASLLFCHPSRLANTYEPGIEAVRQEASLIPGETVRLDIRHGCARPPVRPGWRSRLASLAGWRETPLNLQERLVYDARPVFNGNMAHLVQHHLAALGYLQARLGHGREAVLVILEGRPPRLAREVFSLLGYEVLATDRPVIANRVELAVEQFFHLLPWVRHLNPPLPGGGPRRLFIPRKASRRLRNEADIAACLRAHGFEKVCFEDIAIPEQWALMRGATHVAAIHGAALGCLAFQAMRGVSPPDSALPAIGNIKTPAGGEASLAPLPPPAGEQNLRLLEFFAPGFVVSPFRKFIAVLGGEWAGCRGRITPAVARDIDRPGQAKAHAFDDFELAAATVEAGLAYLDQGERP